MKNDRNKDINDEIKRIKSLFTEERLYGNLIDEQKKKLLPKTAAEFNPRKDPKYYFVTATPTVDNLSNVWNFYGLKLLEERTNSRRAQKGLDPIKIIDSLKIADDDEIKGVIELWTKAIDGVVWDTYWFETDEERFLKQGVEKFNDLVSLSKAIKKFNETRNFKSEVEDEYINEPWLGRTDDTVLYKAFVEPLSKLPYAITKKVKESDHGPAQDAMILKTWAEYKKWVEDHVEAYQNWVDKQYTKGGTKYNPEGRGKKQGETLGPKRK